MKDILFGAIIGDMCGSSYEEISIKIWNLTKLS